MKTDLQSGRASPAGATPSVERESTVIAVTEEQLNVSKRLVESGAVRVRKIVHEDVHVLDKPLSVETTEVERVTIGRPIDAPVDVRYEGDVMIIPVVEERIVVRKQLFLVEEIHLKRQTRTHSEAVEVTLRREEAITERLDVASGEWRLLDTGNAGGK